MGKVYFLLDRCRDARELVSTLEQKEVLNEKLSTYKILSELISIKETCEKAVGIGEQ